MMLTETEQAWQGACDCCTCELRAMDLFSDMREQDFQTLLGSVDELEYERGTQLFAEGSQAQGIFCLRSGTVKLVRNALRGRDRIVGVLHSGGVAGLEALVSPNYHCDAVALTPVSVCRIPLQVIQDMARKSASVYPLLMHRWHTSLKDSYDWLANLNFGSARQRVCHLILKMQSATEVGISSVFSREDMGSMLGLKFETVSREITALVRQGAIQPLDKQGRRYRIINLGPC